jgi:hypothetical protein
MATIFESGQVYHRQEKFKNKRQNAWLICKDS